MLSKTLKFALQLHSLYIILIEFSFYNKEKTNGLLGNKCVWETDKQKLRSTVKLVSGAGEVSTLFFIKNKMEISATEGAGRDLLVILMHR